MKPLVLSGWWWLFAALLLGPFLGGCSKKPAEPGPAPGGRVELKSPGATPNHDAKEDPPPAPQATHAPPSPLSETERRDHDEWSGKKFWAWEADPRFRQQRPVGLIVLRPDGLEHTIPTALRHAAGQANASWDVKILQHLTGNERADLDALRKVRTGIAALNAALNERNVNEKGVPADVAPLRLIDAPQTFKTADELEAAIKQWLAGSFLGGHQFGPPARAPFGGVSFSGHGRSVPRRDDPLGPPKALQFQVRDRVPGGGLDGEWFDLSQLEALILREYQAPVWVLTDLCRDKKPVPEAKIGAKDGAVGKLKPRAFKNLANLAPADQTAVAECEALRDKTTAGGLHRRWAGATTLNATHRLKSIDDDPKRLLNDYFGKMLEHEVSDRGAARPRFKNLFPPDTSITLAQARAWAADQFRANGIDPDEQHPDLIRGAFSEWAIVYSALRGRDVYQPLYPNLLAEGVSRTAGGFTVPELAAEPEHCGPVTAIRKQKDFDTDFKAVFRFKRPFNLSAGANYRLVLEVSGRGPAGAGAVRFAAGVYDAKNQLLNPSFKNYGAGEPYKSPVKCDGARRLIQVPLTLAKGAAGAPPEVAGFEVQAAPDQPDANWNQDVALTVHAVYLVPDVVNNEQLKKDIERGPGSSTLGHACVWDIALHHDRPEAVDARTSEKETVLSQPVKDYAGRWGAAGAVYPKLYADAGGQQLRVKLETKDGAAVAESAEVCVYVCSADRVLAARTARLAEATKGQVIPITDSGLINEIVVVVRNHAGPISLTELELENAPAGK